MTDLAVEEPRTLPRGYLPRLEASFNVLDFPLGEIEDNFSLARAALALARERAGMPSAWQRTAPWEKRYFEALAKGRLTKAAVGQGDQVSGIDGGFLAPEVWSDQFFGLLRSFSVIDQLPITRLVVPARITHIPRVTGDVSVTYPGENRTVNFSQFQFGQLSYTARKAAIEVQLSNELIQDAGGLADQVIRREGALALALDRDTQILLGAGGIQPMGLVTAATAGVISKYYVPGTVGGTLTTSPSHGTPSFNHVSQLKGKVQQLNLATQVPLGQARCDGIIVHSRFEQTVLTLGNVSGPWTDAQGRPLWMTSLNEDGGLGGVKWVLTNLLPTNSTDGGGTASSYMVAGWWQQYVLFECAVLSFDATLEGPGFASDATTVRLIHRWDGAPAHPEAFAVLAGVDP